MKQITRFGIVVGLGLSVAAVNSVTAATLTTLHSFNATDGAGPQAALVQGGDGNFYGTASGGGTNNDGALFRITPSGDFTSLYSFTGLNGFTSVEGPIAPLVEGNDGNFYGVNVFGGTDAGLCGSGGCGTAFRVTPSGGYTDIFVFGYTNGTTPEAQLTLDDDGNFYSTTDAGGTNNAGTIYRLTPSGVQTLLHQFQFTDGTGPLGGLMKGTDGNFYGTTHFGGTNACSCGTVFRITPGGSLTSLYSFSGTAGDGSQPQARLALGADGNFYGTTILGGVNNLGTVFRVTPNGQMTILYSFGATDGNGTAVGRDTSGLLLASDGNFYGTLYGIQSGGKLIPPSLTGTDGFSLTTSTGSSNNLFMGTIFRISPAGAYANIYFFTGADGAHPVGDLIQGSDGDLYGTTRSGGTANEGTVFKLELGGAALCSFSIGSTNATFSADGGSSNVILTASAINCAWNAHSNSSFLAITSNTNGIGSASIAYAVAPNSSTSQRTGTLTIADHFFTVVQTGLGCSYSISPTNQFFGGAGDSNSVNVATLDGCAWSAVSNDGFITILVGRGGGGRVGSGAVDYVVTANNGSSPRTGTMTIAGQTFIVEQAGAGCNFSISPTNQSFSASGGADSVAVTAPDGCDWTAASNNGFIIITAGTNGAGSGMVDYAVAANDSGTARTGTLTVAGLTFTVTQTAQGQASADLALSKTGDPTSLIMDSNLTYSLHVTNLGPDTAANVAITDALPASVSFVSASPGCTNIAGTVVCGLGDLASGDSITKIVVVSPSTIGIITNTAMVSSTTPDPNVANNAASAVTTVTLLQADLGINKSGSPGSVGVGSNLTYTVAVTNHGPDSATGVTVTDPLPAIVAFVSASPGCTNNNGIVTCGLGDLGNGSSTSIQIVVTPNTAGSITNAATVTASEADPVPGNNTATAITTVQQSGGGGGGSLTGTLSKVKQKCKTKNGVTSCALSAALAVLNNGNADVAPVHIRFFLSTDTNFDDGVDLPLGEATSKTIKTGKTGKLKLKGTTTASASGQFILAVDDNNHVLASLQVP